MSTEVWQDGVRRQFWDDVTRTYSAWNADGSAVAGTPRPYTATENSGADVQALSSARITGFDQRVAALEAIVIGNLPAPPSTPTFAALTAAQNGAVYVGQLVVWTDAATYRCIAGPLNSTATPAAYPNGWAKQGVVAAAWVVGKAYKVGDQVTYGGHTYQCAIAHTSQAGWEPGAAPSLWQLIS